MNTEDLHIEKTAATLRELAAASVMPTLVQVGGIDIAYAEKYLIPLFEHDTDVLVLKGGAASPPKTTTAVKESLSKALVALGYEADRIAFLRLGEESVQAPERRPLLARVVVELCDPRAVVTIDPEAWELIADEPASGLTSTVIRGRPVLYVGDFASVLSSEKEKQRSWALLKTIKYQEGIY